MYLRDIFGEADEFHEELLFLKNIDNNNQNNSDSTIF